MENRFVNHIKEKAPAYALAVVVGLGSLALLGEAAKDDGEDPGRITSQSSVEHIAQDRGFAQAVPYEHGTELENTSIAVLP